MILINTRPKDLSGKINELCDQEGIGLQNIYLSKIRPIEIDTDNGVYREIFENLDKYSNFIFTSQAAVKNGAKLIKLKSKLLNKTQLENLGYNLVIYPVSTQRLAMQNVEIGLKSIFNDGHQNNIIDKMQTRKRLYELVEYEKYNTPDKKITDFSTEGHE